MKQIIQFVIFLLVFVQMASAQNHLKKIISLNSKQQPLQDVLVIISNQAEFNFSYNSKILPKDSLITINIKEKSVVETLRLIFNANYEFKESGNYVIIRKKAVTTSSIVEKSPVTTDYFFIKGVVIDATTGEKINNATIYEKQNLLSSMTDDKGVFSLKLKNKFKSASVAISKENYVDTTVDITTNYNQQLTIALNPKEQIEYTNLPDTLYSSSDSSLPLSTTRELSMEERWISAVFLSSKQKLQNLNLKKFYTTRAYQISLVPGISSHGKMNAQVINGVSLNLIGGYSGGTSILEIGGVFNIDKKEVKSCQIAGCFNIDGASMEGVQIAGCYNDVQDSVKGVQVAGIMNNARSWVQGIQIGLINKANTINGMQIGLINITNNTKGTSIGLINISKGKYRRVGILLRVPRNSRRD